ncbi:terminase large subunit domain-containing protein [Leucobacter musarum]|uniref:terminase large subunit domain-containing protein n=1 Tax=Leucobacter musarum TaxID=1930747 RepID=UPI0006A7C2FD|nr:terminase large subunit [Leucobacter musarum]
MPRRQILNAKLHDRNRSLGFLAVWFIETFVVHGRGDIAGQPIRYGDEYSGFIVDCYALDKRGRRLYDSAFFSRPKGTDKSGVAAALVLLEAFGPSRFAGWAKGGETYTFLGQTYVYSEGEPMGKPVTNPVIRILATEEGQTGNVYDSVYYNLNDEETPLNQLVKAYGVDVGKTRVILPKSTGGGSIEPMSSGAASKDGGLETFAVFDESHLYNVPRLKEMYATVTRNLRKRKKIAEPWYIETTTMYQPGEESVAEDTYRLADLIEEGRTRRARLLFDHRWGELGDARQGDEETVDQYEARIAEAFADAYGDAAAWNDVEDMLDAFFDPRNKESEQRRFFLNALVAASNAWLQISEWSDIGLRERMRVARSRKVKYSWRPPRKGDKITLGFDGSRSDDSTVLIGCRVSDGYVWPILIEEPPDSEKAKTWTVDQSKVDARVRQTLKTYDVVGFFADPPFWQDYVEAWDREFGDQMAVRGTRDKGLHFYTNNHKTMAMAVERAHTAIVTGQVVHGNEPQFTRHVINARNWERSVGTVIGKDKRGSKNKMDAAVGMVLALEARARYLAKERPDAKPFEPFNPRGNAHRRR